MKAEDSLGKSERLERLYNELSRMPPDEYIAFLGRAPKEDLEPEVLARMYREFCKCGAERCRRATQERMPDFFGTIYKLAKKFFPRSQRVLFRKDLLQQAAMKVFEMLPKKTGNVAEQDWSRYCRYRFFDVMRDLFERRGERAKTYTQALPGGDGEENRTCSLCGCKIAFGTMPGRVLS